MICINEERDFFHLMEDKLVSFVSSHDNFSFLPTEESNAFLSELLILKNKGLLYYCYLSLIVVRKRIFLVTLLIQREKRN